MWWCVTEWVVPIVLEDWGAFSFKGRGAQEKWPNTLWQSRMSLGSVSFPYYPPPSSAETYKCPYEMKNQHNHWFSGCTVRAACSTEHAARTVQPLNQWLCEQLSEFSWGWACGPETCRDPSIYEWNWNSDICWFFISYVERMHSTKSLKYKCPSVFKQNNCCH
jgi:hypothetical protein